jgi:hypothetical protein
MAHRQFTDSAGVVWRVFETDPTDFPADWEHRAAMLHEEFLGGWLTFASGTETRRLAPIPPAWQDMPVQQLGFLCGCAKSDGADCEGKTRAPSNEPGDSAGKESRDAGGA